METRHKRNSIGKESAIALSKSGWWKGLPPRDVATFQMFTDELSMPFGDFHEALEKTLGRPVFTHELAMNYDGLCDELLGKVPAPSMADILNLIPEDKRIVITI